MEEHLKASKLLVVGWDGAEPSIVERMLAQGKLPNLARIKADGAFGRVHTTTPDTSMAAWTSALTGLNPGRHGMVNFVRRPPGKYALRLVDATDRLVPTVFSQAHMEGYSVASFGVPGTWPAEQEVDICISGFDSPLATEAPRRAFKPRSIYEQIQGMGLGWPYGSVDELSMDPHWHIRAHARLMKNIDLKQEVIHRLSPPSAVDLLWVVFSESDTAGHHFWGFTDPRSPRHRTRNDLSNSIEDIYKRLDKALGRLMDDMVPGASVLVLSDHGFMGASDQVVYINRWLASQGFLVFKHPGMLQKLAPIVRDTAARMVPSAAKELILRTPLGSLALGLDAKSRFGAVELSRSMAFCDELPQNPGIWINVKEREPFGCISAGEEFLHTMDRIAEGLLKWRHVHTGKLVVSRVLRRTDAMAGPASRLSPDLLCELAHWDGYRLVAGSSEYNEWPLMRRLNEDELIGPKGIGTSGAHAPEGICAAMGPGVKKGAKIEDAYLEDIAPSVLRLLGLEPTEDLDGRPIGQVAPMKGDKTTRNNSSGKITGELTDMEQEAINRKLEGLGYM